MAAFASVVPGKLIIMGEHAVVHGCPAIVATFGLHCQVSAHSSSEEGVTFDLPNIGMHGHESWADIEACARNARQRWNDFAHHPTPESFGTLKGNDEAHLVRVAIGEAALYAGSKRPRGMILRVDSELPPGSGFGSSAAVATATISSVLALSGIDANPELVRGLALEVERRQHGEPSGIDHGSMILGGVVKTIRGSDGRFALVPIAPQSNLLDRFSVYHSGVAKEATGTVVAAVRARLGAAAEGGRALLERMAASTLRLSALLEQTGGASCDAIALVRDYQRCLEQLGVVPEPVRQIIEDVEAAGGAAKISGAGSLAGPGAGALLVLWPESAPPLPTSLASLRRLFAPLGVAGLRVTEIKGTTP